MRYNIFNEVHRPLKLALLDTMIHLNNDNIPEDKTIVSKVNNAVRIFKEQLAYETTYLLPLVFEYEPSIWDAFTKDHQRLMNMARSIQELVAVFEAVSNRFDQLYILTNICEAFDAFTKANYHHMDDEEEVVNEVLWRYYSDDKIMQVPVKAGIMLQELYKSLPTYASAA